MYVCMYVCILYTSREFFYLGALDVASVAFTATLLSILW